MLVVWVKAMDRKIRRVGVVEDVIERGDDWIAHNVYERRRGPVEGRVDVDCYRGEEYPKANEDDKRRRPRRFGLDNGQHARPKGFATHLRWKYGSN